MLKHRRLLLLISLLASLAVWITASAQESSPRIDRISIEGALTPITVSYVQRSIRAAETNQAQALLIILDTPGGRIDWMQQIVQAIRASEVPVVVYVSPRGAQAVEV